MFNRFKALQWAATFRKEPFGTQLGPQKGDQIGNTGSDGRVSGFLLASDLTIFSDVIRL
jgi:hypothetical protein